MENYTRATFAFELVGAIAAGLVILVMLGVFSQSGPDLACYQAASAKWCAPR